MARMVNCIKLGREAEGMDFPPMPGELGKRIWENVSKEAWQQWIKLQTMLINENRLNLVDPRRMMALGFADQRPVADNAAPDGRSRNRRVAINIEANVPDKVVEVPVESR